MNSKIRRYVDLLEAQVRDADARIEELESQAYREKIGGKLQIYRETGLIRRRKEETERKLETLRAAALAADAAESASAA